MKKLALLALLVAMCATASAESLIRVNQIGYLPQDIKVAVMIREQPEDVKLFKVTNVVTGIT